MPFLQARKALRALKGLVRLQAIIRGHAVRRQTIATLKRLQSIVNIQSEVCAQRCTLVNNTTEFQENLYQDLRERDIKASKIAKEQKHSIGQLLLTLHTRLMAFHRNADRFEQPEKVG